MDQLLVQRMPVEKLPVIEQLLPVVADDDHCRVLVETERPDRSEEVPEALVDVPDALVVAVHREARVLLRGRDLAGADVAHNLPHGTEKPAVPHNLHQAIENPAEAAPPVYLVLQPLEGPEDHSAGGRHFPDRLHP